MTEDSVRTLADDTHRRALAADPLAATLYGAVGYDHLVPDLSAAADARAVADANALLARADALTPTGVDDDVTLASVRYAAESAIAYAEVGLVEMSPGPYGDGPAVLIMTASRTRATTADAAADHLERARGYATYLDQAGERLREGTSNGRTPPAMLLDVAIGQVDQWLAEDGLGALGAVEGPSPEFSVELGRIVETSTRPAFERYRAVLADLRPTARPDDRCGLVHLPGGGDDYERLVRHHTTLPTTGQEVHETGLQICDELEARMVELGATLGLDGLPAIVTKLREIAETADPTTAMAAAREAVRKAESVAPQWFSPPLPGPCSVEAMDSGMARAGMAPHFTPPSPDGSRPGTYWFNAELPGVGGGWDLESVAYHEAVPGHHLQIARDLLQADLPALQTQSSVTAMSEGWGLYAEVLAGEMGLYSSDEQRLGALGVQMMRACRLVVDSGMHALGWPREQAVAFVLARVPMPEAFARAEVSRYVSIPGQALAYMTGQRHILALRADAERRLAEAFDPKAFHDAVLGHGRVPLPALSAAVESWVSTALTSTPPAT